MRRPRSGMVLLEVMLGTVVLTMSGVALITLLMQTVQTVRIGRETEQRTLSAANVLSRLTQLSDAELAMRAGRARVGAWDVDVSTLARPLITIDIRDTLSGAVVLETMVYRSAPALNAQ